MLLQLADKYQLVFRDIITFFVDYEVYCPLLYEYHFIGHMKMLSVRSYPVIIAALQHDKIFGYI
jgi:hypothetical protein